MPKIDLDERIKIHDLVLEDIDLGAGTARLSADREPKGRKEAVVAAKRQTASSSFMCPTSALHPIAIIRRAWREVADVPIGEKLRCSNESAIR
jgi:hypothetical protein